MNDKVGNGLELFSYVYVPENGHHGFITEFIDDGDERFFRISDSTIYSGKDVVSINYPEYKLIIEYRDFVSKLLKSDVTFETKDFLPISVLVPNKFDTQYSFKDVVSLEYSSKFPIVNFLSIQVKNGQETELVEFYKLKSEDKKKILQYPIELELY